MKNTFYVVLATAVLALPCVSLAHEVTDWYGKEGQDEKPYYMEAALAKLPADKADDFRDDMKDADDQNKPLQEKIYQLHGELHDILTAPEFDKNAFVDKREEIEKLHYKIERNRTEAFALAVSELDQDERVTLSRDLHHYMKHKKSWLSKSTTKSSNDNANYTGESDASIKH